MAKTNPTAPGRRPGPSRAGTATAAALTPKEVFGMLRRHFWLTLFMVVFGGAAGIVGWKFVCRYAPLYKAQAAIEVLPPVDTDPMEIIPVQVGQDVQYGHRVAIANLMSSQRSRERLVESDRVKRTRWYRREIRPDLEQNDVAKKRQAVRTLEEKLNVFPHREAGQIIVSMTCGNREDAAVIVNEMIRLFVNEHGDVRESKIVGDLSNLIAHESELEERVEELDDVVKREIDGFKKDVNDLQIRTGLTDIGKQTGRYFQHTITVRLNDLELQENDLSLAITQLQADIGRLKILAEGPISEQIEHAIERDPVMLALAQRLALAQAQLSGQLTKFGEDHRVVRQIRESIDEIEQKRNQRKLEIAEQTRRANLLNAQDSLHVLTQRLTELQRLRDQAMQKQLELDGARREYDQLEMAHEAVMEKRTKEREQRLEELKETQVQIGKLRLILKDREALSKLRRMGEAPEPLEMVISRRWILWIPGGVMLGLIFGLSLGFLVEMVNDLVRTPSDVRRYLRLPLLGVIPEAEEDRAVDGLDLYRVVDEAPYSLLGESYRRCRTNLDLSGDGGPKTLLVASGDAGDGKTSVACNLAAAFVAKHERVLLIDGNLRRPKLHLAYPHEGADDAGRQLGAGLTSVLTGQCEAAEAIRSSDMEGLDLIHAGPPTPNPAELLASRRMNELIKRLAGRYDRIIIDSPPVLLVSDVKVLARPVDATLLVFNAATTKRGAAQRTILELQDVGAHVIGCVLFAAEAMKGGYFRQQHRAYRRYLKPQMRARSAS
jgi:capsular exopolysaccharide synthesis family protein